MTEPTPPLAVSMGEPAGIGPDLVLQLYAERGQHKLPPFVIYGNLDFLRQRSQRLELNVKLEGSTPEEAAQLFSGALPVLDIEGAVSDRPGDPSQLSAHVVIEAISRATADTMRGACRAVVTAPIHKGVLYGAGFAFPGHTEFLASLCAIGGTPQLPVMMLAHEAYRVVPLTVHVPLSKVPGLVTTELINTAVRTLAHDLRLRFGIADPKLALTGLNPHAGEGGTIGREEVDIIGPAVTGLQQEGFAVEGPIPADTLFYPPHWKRYDAVVAMYHDQALIPIKTVAFDSAVNVTLGLPIVRTSPDHGTAFDLAGTGKGSTASFLAALRLADKLTGGGA